MTAKEYLEQPKVLREEIRKDKDRIASMRSIVENCTTHLSFTAGCDPSKNKAAFEDVMLDITEAEAALEEKVKRLAETEFEILAMICSLSETKGQTILQMRYLEDMKWGEIANQLILSKPYIYEIHREALEEFERIFQKQSKT